ncbi:MAG: thiol:disulfide interchange protein TlpA [Chitinophagaceae bacterium]|nr:thiol:disulfide interchange protein TlpA [Chitinophagaceae bacterium]
MLGFDFLISSHIMFLNNFTSLINQPMRRAFFILLFTAAFISTRAQVKKQAAATTVKPTAGYNIPITIKPLQNKWIYLYSYYGKNYQIADSVLLDPHGAGILKGKTKLSPGIYLTVLDHKLKLFDVLMDKEQHFSITADTSHLDDVKIIGSKENDLYTAYSKFLSQIAPRLNGLQQQLQSAKTKADSAVIRDAMAKTNKELNNYRDNLIKTNPNSMLAAFFMAVKRPDAPAIPIVNGKPDSLYPGRYLKEHYWDDVSFNDDRLLRTPFFDPKLDEYFKYYVSPEPDSIIPEINYMLLSARETKDMYKYLLGRFTDKYINPEIMGQDKVFLFLFNNYFSKGDTSWLNKGQREFIFNRAYSLMANQIGELAPQLNLVDTLGKELQLYNLKSPFTFVIFWDPNCGHCKEMVPRIDSIYNAGWKQKGVQVYAVNVDEGANPAWKTFIAEHHLNNWVHAYQTKEQRDAEVKLNQPNYRQLYDITQTPTLYLLDKDKHIIGKKLTIEQFNDLIDAKLKSKN